MQKLLAASLLAASASSPDVYATPKVDLEACLAGARNHEQQGHCYRRAITEQRNRLNAAYKKVIARRTARDDHAGIAALNSMQTAWVAWRDQTFTVLAEHTTGASETLFTVCNEFLLHAVTKQADMLEEVDAFEGGRAG